MDCTNTEGTFTCSCGIGYSLDDDSNTCVDVDECAEGTDRCDNFATCTDTDGSYECECNEGFTDVFGNGRRCRDNDPNADGRVTSRGL